MFIRDPGGTTLLTEALHPHSMDEVSQSLVVLFEAYDLAVPLIKHFIDLEMAKANVGGKREEKEREGGERERRRDEH
jgi:hypothetical protein